MGRTKELLEEQFADGEWDEIMSCLNTDISPSIYSAMEKYGRECSEASLKEASKGKTIYKLNNKCERVYGVLRESITNPDNIILL